MRDLSWRQMRSNVAMRMVLQWMRKERESQMRVHAVVNIDEFVACATATSEEVVYFDHYGLAYEWSDGYAIREVAEDGEK